MFDLFPYGRTERVLHYRLSNNRTELLVKVLKVFQDSKCHKEMSEEILVECLAYLHDCAKHNGVLSMVHLFKVGPFHLVKLYTPVVIIYHHSRVVCSDGVRY